jgi:hypothetical protein
VACGCAITRVGRAAVHGSIPPPPPAARFVRGLVPGVHYLVAEHPNAVLRITRWLLANPERAEAIGRAGRQFAVDHLLGPKVQCWWHSYFAVMNGLLAEPVQRAPLSLRVHLNSTRADVYRQFNRAIDVSVAVEGGADGATAAARVGILPTDEILLP